MKNDRDKLYSTAIHMALVSWEDAYLLLRRCAREDLQSKDVAEFAEVASLIGFIAQRLKPALAPIWFKRSYIAHKTPSSAARVGRSLIDIGREEEAGEWFATAREMGYEFT